MIESLELENWKSHSASAFSFGKGTNVLLGRMGSGKSSALDALCFALYGTFPKMSRRDQSTESVVSISSGAENAVVKLSFSKQGKRYQIARKVGKKTSEAEIRCDGKLVQKGAKPVTDHVTSILGVDYELFTRAIYSEQNRMDHLLSLSPRNRKAEIDWLLGLGDFDTARDSAQAISTKLSEQSDALFAEADPKKTSETAKKMQEQQEEEKKLSASCTLLGKKKEELASKCKKADEAVASLGKIRGEWRKRKTECDQLSGSVSGMAREAEGKTRLEKSQIEKLAQGRKELESSLLEAKEAAKKLQASLSSSKSETAVLQKTIELASSDEKKSAELGKRKETLSCGKELMQLEKKLAAQKAEAEEISSRRALILAEAEELEKAAHALRGASAKCPVCDSNLEHGKAEGICSAKKASSAERKKQAEALSGAIAKKKEEIAGLEKTIAELRLISSQIEKMKSDAVDSIGLEARKKAAQEKTDRLEAQAKEMEEAISRLEGQLEDARKAHEEAVRTEKLLAEFEAARKKLADAQAALEMLTFDEEKYDAARKAAEVLSVELARAESDFNGEEKRLKTVSELRAVLQTELADMEKKQSIAKKFAGASQEMLIYKNSLSAAQSELRATLQDEINQALEEIWPAIYPYQDYDGVRLDADEKDYRLLMHKDGEWREVDAVASGGERACLCLSLRIAFATVLTPDIGWLILDEPTHNLDAEAVTLLAEAINLKIPSIVEQTFVITHDIALGQSAEGAVFRLERDKAKGEPTKVERI